MLFLLCHQNKKNGLYERKLCFQNQKLHSIIENVLILVMHYLAKYRKAAFTLIYILMVFILIFVLICTFNI